MLSLVISYRRPSPVPAQGALTYSQEDSTRAFATFPVRPSLFSLKHAGLGRSIRRFCRCIFPPPTATLSKRNSTLGFLDAYTAWAEGNQLGRNITHKGNLEKQSEMPRYGSRAR